MECFKLTDEQRAALQGQSKGPVYLIDVNSNDRYVVLREQDYEHFKALFETVEFDISETYAGQSEALKGVWDDPALDVYNQ